MLLIKFDAPAVWTTTFCPVCISIRWLKGDKSYLVASLIWLFCRCFLLSLQIKYILCMCVFAYFVTVNLPKCPLFELLRVPCLLMFIGVCVCDYSAFFQSALFKAWLSIICLYVTAALSSWHASFMCVCRCVLYSKDPSSPCLHMSSRHFTVPWHRESPFPPTSAAAVC